MPLVSAKSSSPKPSPANSYRKIQTTNRQAFFSNASAPSTNAAQRFDQVPLHPTYNARSYITIKLMAVDLASSRVKVVPGVRSGQPIIRGTRITVWDILGWLGGGVSEPEILNDYPELTSDDIKAALQFAYQLKDKVPR